MRPRAAIGLLAKAPWPGLAKTRLIPALGATGAAALAHGFLLDSAALVRASGIDAILFVAPAEAVAEVAAATGLPGRPQCEGDLGARISGAFADLFATGAAPVLLIGADSPTLPIEHLRAALALAAAHADAVVLGPAEDGGFWGIALSRPVARLFDGIAWGTDAVLAETRAGADRLGLTVRLAPAWHDVDEPADLTRLRADLVRDPSAAPHTRAALARAA
jgi:rSAM/selenodomain-associated transferase 1